MNDELNNLRGQTSGIVVAAIASGAVRGEADIINLIGTVFGALQAAGSAAAPTTPIANEEHVPAVTARKSLASPEHIISMIDGKPYKTLKRHITRHGLSPAQYRERFGLKADYPMTAPAYSEKRSAMAKKIGLGRKPGDNESSHPA